MDNDKHEFAFFVPELSVRIANEKNGHDFFIIDESLYHRMVHILRLSVGQNCIFFDYWVHAVCVIAHFSEKRKIVATIILKKQNAVLLPSITFLLPLLKRADLEAALYNLTVVGTTTIQLITTHKIHSSSWSAKDHERAHRIIIAAAEQSKQFAGTQLKAPIAYQAALQQTPSAKKILFDSHGMPLFELITGMSEKKVDVNIVLLIGPEADLTQEEKKMAINHHFVMCALTPTVLRSEQAALLGAGIIRSFIA